MRVSKEEALALLQESNDPAFPEAEETSNVRVTVRKRKDPKKFKPSSYWKAVRGFRFWREALTEDPENEETKKKFEHYKSLYTRFKKGKKEKDARSRVSPILPSDGEPIVAAPRNRDRRIRHQRQRTLYS